MENKEKLQFTGYMVINKRVTADGQVVADYQLHGDVTAKDVLMLTQAVQKDLFTRLDQAAGQLVSQIAKSKEEKQVPPINVTNEGG